MNLNQADLVSTEGRTYIAGSSNLGSFMPALQADLLYRDAVNGLRVVNRILDSTDDLFSDKYRSHRGAGTNRGCRELSGPCL